MFKTPVSYSVFVICLLIPNSKVLEIDFSINVKLAVGLSEVNGGGNPTSRSMLVLIFNATISDINVVIKATHKMSPRSPLLLPCLLLLLSQCGLLSGYSAGGPRSQCGSMTPGHGLAPQSSSSPFEVQVKI